MTISVWRYSHLALAVSSFLLLTLASITGIILAFEPVLSELKPYKVSGFSEITLDQTLPVLRKTYPGITELSVNAQGFVQIKGSTDDGDELLAYVNPLDGKLLGKPSQQSEFFQWVTGLHRSLFLHETGRFFVGLTAFLLMLITVSGIALVIQRQRGIRHFFKRIARDSFAQYYHVILSRWSLIPILLISLSGTYLSLARFELVNMKKESAKVDFDMIKDAPVREAKDFEAFKSTPLAEVETVEFPFSEDVEDYYVLKTKTAELAVNQITGEVLAESKYPMALFWANMSLDLHTGRSNSIWAVVLAIAAGNILFFIYSGFAITLKRRSNRVKNMHKPQDCSHIILVGSENGSTFGFAKAIHHQLIKSGKKSYLTELNNYQVFPKAEQLVVVTATYGLGEAPTNAAKFFGLLKDHPQQQQVKFSVLGFGSRAYPDFCKFAFEVHRELAQQTWAEASIDVHTVNDKSPEDFGLWAEAWSQQSGIALTLLPELYGAKTQRLERLTVLSNEPELVLAGEPFKLNLKGRKRLKVQSGDLLAIYPANDHRERLYSIGVIDKEISLNVKLHDGGLGSKFLQDLKAGQEMQAKVIRNAHFHFPTLAPEVIMISNGTGIAPFLGMINENTRQIPCHLYCGFRERRSYERYETFLEDHRSKNRVQRLCAAFSREALQKQYVSDLIRRDAELIVDVLMRAGVVMICGSLAMQKDVMELLEEICQQKAGKSVVDFQSQNQILTDCY